MRFRLGTSPPHEIVGCATFLFRVGFRLLSRPSATMVTCGRVLTLGYLVFVPVFSFNSFFIVSPPPRHADGARGGFDGGLFCHCTFFVSPPPPHWRYPVGFDGWFAFYRVCVSFNYFCSRLFWRHRQAVQRCGGGF